MNLAYILLYSFSTIDGRFVSTIIRENKLYAISKTDLDNNFQVTVYELKEGSIRDIFNKGTSYSLAKLGSGFDLKFFDAPDTLKEDRNKLWLKADQTAYGPEINNSYTNFIGYINLNDMTFKADSSLIKFPTAENFPLFGYTMNTIVNDRETALYITGGVIYSKSKDAYISSNSFFKYNFATKEWKDMSPDVQGKLNPVYNHTSVVVDKTLVLIGGRVAKDPTKNSTLNISEDNFFKINSIYNLTKFDTVTNNWQSMTLNISMFDSSVASLQLTEFSASFYRNKVYALGGLATSNDKQAPDLNTKLGILDYRGNQWSWSPVFDDTGNIYRASIQAKSALIYNDQIILTSGKSIEKESDGFQVFNLTSQRMQSNLKVIKYDEDNSNQNNGQSALPSYANALIAVGSILLIILIIFIFYRKYNRNKTNPQSYNNEPKNSMEATWSNPEDPNIEFIINGIKENDIISNSYIKHSNLKLENPMIEKSNCTQEYIAAPHRTTNTSITLHSNSSNY